MKTLSYKGYIGSIEVCKEDNCLYGKVLAIPDDTYITYQGSNEEELKHDFEEAVDHYLSYCQEEGIKPYKTYSGSLSVRISPDIHSRVASLAKQTGLSIKAFVRKAIENQIASML